MEYIDNVKLLNSTQNIRELNLKEFRTLLKCFLGDDINPKLIFNNTNQILQNVCNLSFDNITNYNFIDYILLLLNLRAISVGNIVNLFALTDTQKELKIDLNIDNIINTIFTKITKIPLTAINYNNITITLQIPSIKDILQFETNNLTLNTIFIKNIKLNNLEVVLYNLPHDEREKIVKSLPIKLIVQLDYFIDSFLKKLNDINILESVNTKEFDRVLPLTLNTQILAFIIKLIFNFDLKSVYSSMFLLSKGANLDGNFLDNCSPGEFFLFTKKLEEIYYKQENQSNASIPIGNNNLPPINPNSEFTLE